jgi:hypothetical protein
MDIFEARLLYDSKAVVRIKILAAMRDQLDRSGSIGFTPFHFNRRASCALDRLADRINEFEGIWRIHVR